LDIDATEKGQEAVTFAGVIFDKDGTLFDFNATWGAWAKTMIDRETGGDGHLITRLADRLGYDLAAERFLPGSIVIAETIDVTADAILEVLPGKDKSALIERMNAAAIEVPQKEAAPLGQLLMALRSQGLALGVVTNDSEQSARAHLAKSEVESAFDFIVGCDSGFGGKPEAGQLMAFCRATKLDPKHCAMVGDSTHDLLAGRAAGMVCVGVLTGPAPREELEPYADVVLESIAELPSWLTSMSS